MKIIFPEGGAVMRSLAVEDDIKLLPTDSYYLRLSKLMTK
jgi:hypothetical protein